MELCKYCRRANCDLPHCEHCGSSKHKGTRCSIAQKAEMLRHGETTIEGQFPYKLGSGGADGLMGHVLKSAQQKRWRDIVNAWPDLMKSLDGFLDGRRSMTDLREAHQVAKERTSRQYTDGSVGADG